MAFMDDEKGEAATPSSPRLSLLPERLRRARSDKTRAPYAPSVDRANYFAVALQIACLPCSPRCLSGCGSYAFGGGAVVCSTRTALSCMGNDRLPAKPR